MRAIRGQQGGALKVLMHRSVPTLALRTVGVAAAFMMHLFIARLLGAEESGVIFLAWAILFFCVVLGKRAMDTALFRHAGPAWERTDNDRLQSLLHEALRQSLRYSLVTAVGLALLAVPLAWSVFSAADLLPVLLLFAATIIPYSRTWVYAGLLKVANRPRQAIATEAVIVPLLMLVAIAILHRLQLLSVTSLACAYLLCNLLALAYCARQVRSVLSAGRARPTAEPALLASARPLMWLEMLNWLIAWSAVPILGLFAAADEVARYSVAFRVTLQISLVLVVCNAIIAPRFAGLYQQGRIDELRVLARAATLSMLLFAFPLALLLMWHPSLVTLLFGEEFNTAAGLIPVLAFAQLVNVATGPAGYLLVTTGHERLMRNIMLANVLFTLPLMLIFSWKWQAQGAALATALGLILQNLLALAFARRTVFRPTDTGLPVSHVSP